MRNLSPAGDATGALAVRRCSTLTATVIPILCACSSRENWYTDGKQSEEMCEYNTEGRSEKKEVTLFERGVLNADATT